jgi:polar amino acid transport system substrate-binding protein
VVAGSLGEATIKALQPRAALVPLASLAEGIRELQAGRVDGVAGDSITLAASIKSKSATGFELVPAEGYARYAVGCILPENNSTFRNLVNLAIARMIQGYVSGDPSSTALVNRWMGPQSVLGLPPEVIRTYFQTVLLNHEQIRVAPDQPSSPSPQAQPTAR